MTWRIVKGSVKTKKDEKTKKTVKQRVNEGPSPKLAFNKLQGTVKVKGRWPGGDERFIKFKVTKTGVASTKTYIIELMDSPGQKGKNNKVDATDGFGKAYFPLVVVNKLAAKKTINEIPIHKDATFQIIIASVLGVAVLFAIYYYYEAVCELCQARRDKAAAEQQLEDKLEEEEIGDGDVIMGAGAGALFDLGEQD